MKGAQDRVQRGHWLPASGQPQAGVSSQPSRPPCRFTSTHMYLPVPRLPLPSTARPGRWQVCMSSPWKVQGRGIISSEAPSPPLPPFPAWCSACLLSLEHQRFIKAEAQQSVCFTSLSVFLPDEKFSGKGRKLKGVQKSGRERGLGGAAERKRGRRR